MHSGKVCFDYFDTQKRISFSTVGEHRTNIYVKYAQGIGHDIGVDRHMDACLWDR